MEKFIVGNWKCNPESLAQAKELLNFVKKESRKLKSVDSEIVICPPFVFLSDILSIFSDSKAKAPNIKFGAQNCFWAQGAFTGEISVNMLKDLGVEYVIIGHSERRQNFKETDEMVNKKIKAVLGAGLNSILCVGETKEQRQAGKTDDILLQQLEVGLAGIPLTTNYKLKTTNLLIAYEPIWAIGTGNACEPQDAKKARLLIQQEIGEDTLLLYGGSVKSHNVASYMDVGYDGVLVGGASLQADEFVKIIENV